MKKSRAGFAENEKQHTGLPERRKSARLNGGLFYFEDFLKIENVLDANVITAAGWLLEILEITSGEIFFQNGEREIYPKGKSVGIFYAPFTFTRPRGFAQKLKFMKENVSPTVHCQLSTVHYLSVIY